MVIGISCEEFGEISIEDCIKCGHCLPAPLIKSLKQYDNAPTLGKYGIRELIGCLRQAYYKRTIGVRDEYKPLFVLWMMKRGKYLEQVARGTGYNELEGIHLVDVDGEEVQIRGKLDCYDIQTRTIIEIKSTKLFRGFKPKDIDILQLQCYVTLYRNILSGIRGLQLVYFGMNNYLTFDVSIVDQTDYLEERVQELHRSITNGDLPAKEDLGQCRYCVYQNECRRDIPIEVEKEVEIVG